MNSGSSQVFRSARSAYVVFFLIWAFPTLMFLSAVWRRGWVPGSAGVLVLLGIFGAFLYLLLWRYRVEILPDRIRYTSLFTRTVELRANQMDHFQYGMTRNGVGFDVYFRPGFEREKFDINSKVFPVECTECLLKFFKAHGINELE